MSDVPSNLIPTRITQLPVAPVADENSLMMIVYQGNNYQIRVGDLLSVAGVPTSTQVIAGTGLDGGGPLTGNVTLSVAVGGIGNTQLANTGVTSGVYGDATNIPVFTVDAKGRIQSATTVPATISGYVPETRQVIAGTGLNGGGALNANVTLNANLSNAAPLETDGLGTSGVSTDIARADHQHPSVNLGVSSEVDGVLSVANGGTSRSIVPDEGAIIWSGADGLYVGPVGAVGQVMQSNGTGEYLWVNQSTLDVGQADNLNGGAANKIPYQSATDVTGFIDAPTDAETLLKWNGTGFEWGTVAGAGTVTSVGLALPADFNVTNSPVTGSGTLTGAWANQTTNKVLAAPNGSTGTPTFRALANADLPDSGVTANTYGSTTAIPVVTVNAKGVVTSVTTASISGGLVYQGSWNASTNTPTLVSSTGTNGFYYVVSVAGTTNLDGITDWQVGDWAIFNGTAWQKIDQTNTVASVNGQTGVVVLTASDVGAQPADAQLTDIAGLTPSDGNFIVGDGTNFVAESGSTARTSMGAAAAGANSDITSMSGITGAIGTADYVAFDVAYATTLAAGQLGWNGNNTLGLGMAGGNVVQHIGEDGFYYIKASSAITKGQVVMFTGSVGASGVVTGAPATGVTDGTYIMGVAAESLALNGFGLVQFQGTLRGIDTSAYADGDILWYDPAVTGGFTDTKPSAPNVKVQIAAVVYGGSGGSGSILIRVNPGSILGGTDSNVQFGTLANANLIQYNSVSQYWENVTPGSVTGVGSVANSVTFDTTGGAASGTTFNGSAARTIDYSTVGAPKADGTGASGTWSISINGNAATATSATTATNLAGGAASQLAYQTGSGATSFIANGTAGQVLTSAGSSVPAWGGINGGTF